MNEFRRITSGDGICHDAILDNLSIFESLKVGKSYAYILFLLDVYMLYPISVDVYQTRLHFAQECLCKICITYFVLFKREQSMIEL